MITKEADPVKKIRKKRKKEGVIKDIKDTASNIKKRQEALAEASGNK